MGCPCWWLFMFRALPVAGDLFFFKNMIGAWSPLVYCIGCPWRTLVLAWVAPGGHVEKQVKAFHPLTHSSEIYCRPLLLLLQLETGSPSSLLNTQQHSHPSQIQITHKGRICDDQIQTSNVPSIAKTDKSYKKIKNSKGKEERVHILLDKYILVRLYLWMDPGLRLL